MSITDLEANVKTFIYSALIAVIVLSARASLADPLQQNVRPQEEQIQVQYDAEKDHTTVILPARRIVVDTEQYHSVDLSVFFSYTGATKRPPKEVKLELRTVVKARKLNSDLYVAFITDGTERHFSSNRSAILKPVPGRLWVGERMVFSIPTEDFRKLASAEQLIVGMGSARFAVDDSAMLALRSFAEQIN